MLADFKNSFTVGLSSKVATRLMPCFPSHLKCVTTLLVDEAVDQWTARLRTCVKAKGRQFEHLLH